MQVPLEVCESRDCKGLYKLARSGKIKCFTGEQIYGLTPAIVLTCALLSHAGVTVVCGMGAYAISSITA